MEYIARALDIRVRPSDVDEAVMMIRRQTALLDDAAWNDALLGQHITLPQYKQSVTDQLLDFSVLRTVAPNVWSAAGDDPARAQRLNEVAETLVARLGGVELRGSCIEAWPRYHIEHVTFVGFDAETEKALRIAFGRALNGGGFSLGIAGMLPEQGQRVIAEVLKARGVVGRVDADDHSERLRITLHRDGPATKP